MLGRPANLSRIIRQNLPDYVLNGPNPVERQVQVRNAVFSVAKWLHDQFHFEVIMTRTGEIWLQLDNENNIVVPLDGSRIAIEVELPPVGSWMRMIHRLVRFECSVPLPNEIPYTTAVIALYEDLPMSQVPGPLIPGYVQNGPVTGLTRLKPVNAWMAFRCMFSFLI